MAEPPLSVYQLVQRILNAVTELDRMGVLTEAESTTCRAIFTVVRSRLLRKYGAKVPLPRSPRQLTLL